MLELICTKTCSTCRKAVALLDEKGVEYRYREYTREPLDEAEIRRVLAQLGLRPAQVLRKHDKVAKELRLDGSEADDVLIGLMAQHPKLIQRPIGILGDRAVLGRPVEALLELVG